MPLKGTSLFNVDDFYGNQKEMECVYKEITICPSCHVAVVPKILHGYYVKNEPSFTYPYRVNIAMFCVNCRRIFMAEYNATTSPKSYNKVLFAETIRGLYPTELKEKEFSPIIKNLATLDKGKHDKQQENGLSTLPKTPPGCKKGGVFA